METQTEQVVEFTTVGAFLAHLKEVTDETVDVAYVTENLEAILSQPVQTAPRRGQLAGLVVEEMTDEQLKRELINAGSVLYKATQRNAAAETIAKNQARFDAAKAEKASRPSMAKAEVATDAVDGEKIVTNEGEDADTGAADANEEQHPVENEL